MDSFLKSVFVRAGKHTSVHDVHPHTYMLVERSLPLAEGVYYVRWMLIGQMEAYHASTVMYGTIGTVFA